MLKSKIPVPNSYSVSSIPVSVKSTTQRSHTKLQPKEQLKPPVNKAIATSETVIPVCEPKKLTKSGGTLSKSCPVLASSKSLVNSRSNLNQAENSKLKKSAFKKSASSKSSKKSLKENFSVNKAKIFKSVTTPNRQKDAISQTALSNKIKLLQKSVLKNANVQSNNIPQKSSKSASSNSVQTLTSESKKAHREKEQKVFKKNANIQSNNIPKKSFKSVSSNSVQTLTSGRKKAHSEKEQKFLKKIPVTFTKLESQDSKKKIQNEVLSANDKPVPTVSLSPVKQKQINELENIKVNDAEFKASSFYKSLILSERELSPGIMKLCADKKFSSQLENIRTSDQKMLCTKSSDDFVEEVRRNSYLFYQGKGVLQSSKNCDDNKMALISEIKNNPAKFIEELRRNSATCFNRKGQAPMSPLLRYKKSPIKFMQDISMKENINNSKEVKQASDLRLAILKKSNYMQLDTNNQRVNETYLPTTLKEQNILSNKKGKVKKKVTFKIPTGSSPELMLKFNKTIINSEVVQPNNILKPSIVTRITPESGKLLVTNFYSNLNNAKPTTSLENSQKKSTPELNLQPYRLNSDVLPKTEIAENKKPEQNSGTPEFDLKISNNQHLSTISDVPCIKIDSPKCQNSAFYNCELTHKRSPEPETPFKFSSMPELQTSLRDMSIDSSLQSASCTKRFSIRPEKTIFTPRPISVNNLESYLVSSISPTFLTGKSTSLNSLAPLQTPLVLKNFSKLSDIDLRPVCQKLNFNEDTKFTNERRESGIVIRTTSQNLQDILCDQECNILALQSSFNSPLSRPLLNPIASTLNNGDEMHFIPLNSSLSLTPT